MWFKLEVIFLCTLVELMIYRDSFAKLWDGGWLVCGNKAGFTLFWCFFSHAVLRSLFLLLLWSWLDSWFAHVIYS
jgi:hypothetical protein